MYVESEPGKAHLNKLKCGNRIQRGVHPHGDPEINILKVVGNQRTGPRKNRPLWP